MKLWEVHREPERVPRVGNTTGTGSRKVRSPERPSPASRGRRGQRVGGECHMVGEGKKEALTVSCWKVSLEDPAVHLNPF